ncbi:MAG: hypothetical protein WB987_15215, partial [Candidatus Acidiferrales bacterium]
PQASRAAEFLGVQNTRFPHVCVVLRIFNRPDPRYHFPFLYDDGHDTIGRLPAAAGNLGSAQDSLARHSSLATYRFTSNLRFRD